MNNFAVIVAIVVGIACLSFGLYVGIGRRSPAIAGGGTTTTTRGFTIYPFWSKKWFWIILLIAAALAVIAYFSADIASLPVPDWIDRFFAGISRIFAHPPAFSISLFWGLVIGGILFVLGYFMKKPKKMPWLPDLLTAAGVIIVILAVATSGFGIGASRALNRAAECAAGGGCVGTSSDAVPYAYHDGEIVTVRLGEVKDFYAEGTVAIRNPVGSCLMITSPLRIKVWWEQDGTISYVRTHGHGLVPVTVKSNLAGTPPCR